MSDDCGPIIVSAEDGGEPSDTCRNGSLACAAPAAHDLACEFHVPICAECAEEAIGR